MAGSCYSGLEHATGKAVIATCGLWDGCISKAVPPKSRGVSKGLLSKSYRTSANPPELPIPRLGLSFGQTFRLPGLPAAAVPVDLGVAEGDEA